jgi:hypothetical protein
MGDIQYNMSNLFRTFFKRGRVLSPSRRGWTLTRGRRISSALLKNSKKRKIQLFGKGLIEGRFFDLYYNLWVFLILILVFVRMLVRALWHFNEQAKGHLLLVARVPDHSDYPVFPPAPEGEEGPPTPNVIVPPDNAEEILQDLASNLERIFQNEGRVMQEGLPMRDFVDTVLWHGGDLSVLQRIWLEFEEWGLGSEFGIAAENLRRKYEHAERDEPDTPDPDLVEAEASIAKEKEGAGEAAGTSAGPSGAGKRKRDSDSSDSSGGDGGNPAPPGNSPSPDEGGGEVASFIGDLF